MCWLISLPWTWFEEHKEKQDPVPVSEETLYQETWLEYYMMITMWEEQTLRTTGQKELNLVWVRRAKEVPKDGIKVWISTIGICLPDKDNRAESLWGMAVC